MSQKILFIDRDGTIIAEPPDDFQVDSISKMKFLEGSIESLARIYKSGIYEFVMVTNQDGLGTESFPEKDFWPAHNLMMQGLAEAGIQFKDVLIDSSFPEENSPNRKPQTGLLTEYLEGAYDLANSYVIGDRITDIQLAYNMNCKGILLMSGLHQITESELTEKGLDQCLAGVCQNWDEVASIVL